MIVPASRDIWATEGMLGDELDQILKKLNIRSSSCYKSILRQSVSDFENIFYKIFFYELRLKVEERGESMSVL